MIICDKCGKNQKEANGRIYDAYFRPRYDRIEDIGNSPTYYFHLCEMCGEEILEMIDKICKLRGD